MARANPFDFLRALERLGLRLEPLPGASENLAERPRRLMRRLEREGYSVITSRPRADVLRRYGFRPATVFDVGVDAGTPALYEAFPDARFVLIDPLEESRTRAARWIERLGAEFHCCALGAESGTVTLTVPETSAKVRHARASVLATTEDYGQEFARFSSREVPLRRLDDIAQGAEPPFGIKIDTEGYELAVIEGAAATLRETEFVIAEVAVKRRFEGGYRFSELIAALGRHGFEPLDFLTPLRPDSADCDMVFARWDSPRFDYRGG